MAFDPSLDKIIQVAKETVKEVNTGEEFIVKDLFRGFEWNRIGKGDRTKLGGMFFHYANNDGSHLLKPLGKTPQNQQRYRKR